MPCYASGVRVTRHPRMGAAEQLPVNVREPAETRAAKEKSRRLGASFHVGRFSTKTSKRLLCRHERVALIATLHGPDRRQAWDRKARLIRPGAGRGSAAPHPGIRNGSPVLRRQGRATDRRGQIQPTAKEKTLRTPEHRREYLPDLAPQIATAGRPGSPTTGTL